jgi:hypothetical protein
MESERMEEAMANLYRPRGEDEASAVEKQMRRQPKRHLSKL